MDAAEARHATRCVFSLAAFFSAAAAAGHFWPGPFPGAQRTPDRAQTCNNRRFGCLSLGFGCDEENDAAACFGGLCTEHGHRGS